MSGRLSWSTWTGMNLSLSTARTSASAQVSRFMTWHQGHHQLCSDTITNFFSLAARAKVASDQSLQKPSRLSSWTSASGRSLRLHPHDALQRAHGARATDPGFQAVYRQHRPMVERSISWLVATGNRRLRFVGTRRNDLWLHHRVAALNLRRLLTLGLARSGGSWVLAPT